MVTWSFCCRNLEVPVHYVPRDLLMCNYQDRSLTLRCENRKPFNTKPGQVHTSENSFSEDQRNFASRFFFLRKFYFKLTKTLVCHAFLHTGTTKYYEILRNKNINKINNLQSNINKYAYTIRREKTFSL